MAHKHAHIYAPPTETDLALLRVVTAPTDETGARWEAWAASADIEVLSEAAHGLLPALYKALEAAGVRHPWLARVRGTYRRHWTERQRHLAAYDAAASVLSEVGIEFLRPADQQVGEFLHEPAVLPLSRPRLSVSWWTAPNALDALGDSGWRVDDAASRRRWSLRARLTRTSWPIAGEGGMSAELVNFFNPWIVDERRDADVWERARAAPGSGPPNASASDVAVAALTDQLDLGGAVRWALGTAAVLDAVGENVSLRPALDRLAARWVLPIVVSRLQLLVREGLSPNARRPLLEAEELAARHRLPTTAPERASDWGRRRVRALARRPTAARQVIARYGGLAGVRSYLARY
jgi:hypothetical protein